MNSTQSTIKNFADRHLKEISNDLIVTYHEVQQTIIDLGKIEKNEEVVSKMHRQLENALHWLDKYVDPDDELEELL